VETVAWWRLFRLALFASAAGFGSRRITEEHRQVYSITNDALLVAACRYHF
jgi:Txe/YoeB family toxin of Txe-Axe toxin-antitoxin module